MFSTELLKTKTGFFGGGGKGHAHPHFGEIMPKKWSFYLRNVRLKLLKLVEERLKELMVKC